jgi:microcystin-dependent protein
MSVNSGVVSGNIGLPASSSYTAYWDSNGAYGTFSGDGQSHKSGGGSAHNNMQPSMVFQYIIKF